MSLDFRFSQGQTNKIIASGSTGTSTGAKLVIFPISADEAGTPNQGFIDQTIFVTSSIGTDIFLYVSGGVGKKGVGGSQAITAFGGDVHISGNLTVDGTYPAGGGGGDTYWVSNVANSIYTTGSVTLTGSLINGANNTASGNAHAEGEYTNAGNEATHTEGYYTTATGK